MNVLPSYTLVLQGGGFRTAYSAGVMDAFIAADFFPFSRVVGVSGGAIVLSYYLGRQYGSALEAMTMLATDDHFMKFTRTISKEGYMDIDYLRHVAEERVPFDLDTAMDTIADRDCHFVATDRRDGRAVYLRPERELWVDQVIASSTLPFFTKGVHELDEDPYFDGGWSDPLPVIWAHEQGAAQMLVVQTAPSDFRLKQTWADYFGSLYFRNMAGLSSCFAESHLRYNAAIDFLQEPPADVLIDIIAPDQSLKSGTFSHSVESLMADYRSGLHHGTSFVVKYREEGRGGSSA